MPVPRLRSRLTVDGSRPTSTRPNPARHRDGEPVGGKLTDEMRQDNRVLAHTRQGVEHVIRRLKIFRIFKGVYRHRRRRFSLRLHLIAALCNLSRARSAGLSQEVY